ncbi:hypothetical protein GP486_003925 [Trichoglossum hirsutum]|uniref:5-formyltetrahydrofolate cyclo-ligase n=1 Tax=Trichoglossum hirsutum TaxID=265104 RepID=A0A9P8RQI4_9PEZI|nr:hypothetical protein GP486_003925 [Trichoglossum hirsutum]
MAATNIAKRELRQVIRKSISEVPPESIASQSLVALNILLSMPEYMSARRIGIYLSMPAGEILTASMVEDAFLGGKRVFIPYIHKSPLPIVGGQPASMMDMLSLHSKADFEAFARDRWGIPTPSKESVSGRENCLGDTGRGIEERVGIEEGEGGLDLMVMPGMAFDMGLRRLGHGKGYFDFFLQRYSDSRKKGTPVPCLVGLALKEQVLPDGESIPTDATDWTLDKLIVGDGRLLHSNTNTKS